jgi:hypothetical protein
VSGKFLTHLGFHGLNRMRGTCDDDVHVHVYRWVFLGLLLSLSFTLSSSAVVFSCLFFGLV